MRAASGTPVTPMMPHIRLSISHASGYAPEIYLSETLDGVLEGGVAQPQADCTAARRHGTDSLCGYTVLLRQRRHGARPLRRACDHGPPMRFAKEEIDGRQA